MTYFGRMLKKLRIERGLRQMDIADAIGVAKGTMSMYESGQRTPSFETAEAIADVLNVPLSFLIESPIPRSVAPSSEVPVGFHNLERITVPLHQGLGEGAPPPVHMPMGIPEHGQRIRSDFALVATGDSMSGSRVLDGDIVFIQSQTSCEDGEIAAIIYEGQTMLRRVYHTPTGVTLTADNPKYPPITLPLDDMDRLHIVGRAIAFRSLL